MTLRTFSCANCNEPFEVHLPEETTKARYNKCEDTVINYHNLERTVQCQNCEQRNTIFYCTDTHPLVAVGD